MGNSEQLYFSFSTFEILTHGKVSISWGEGSETQGKMFSNPVGTLVYRTVLAEIKRIHTTFLHKSILSIRNLTFFQSYLWYPGLISIPDQD